MKAFAIKAASSCVGFLTPYGLELICSSGSTAVKSIANAYELKRATLAEDVLFLFLHSSDTSRDEIVRPLKAHTTQI